MTVPRREAQLTQHIGLGEGIALYVSAILGAGVLVLPGQAASIAGPASLVSWSFACVLGLPLATMFAALARRYPEAGGVSSYVGRGLGPLAGGIAGCWFFVAGSVGQTIVSLTGGYYVVAALSVDRRWAPLVAAAILACATASNLAAVRLGGRVQLLLAAAVAVALAGTVVAAVPQMDLARLRPFAPHGALAVGSASVVLFFAFAGWETVAHLAEEFRDPERDVPRAVAGTVGVISVLYLGIAVAVVLTGTYGTPDTDHVSIGLILRGAFGPGATAAAALVAVVVSLATTTAFVSGVSRLGYALAGQRWLPARLGRVDVRGLPRTSVLAVVGIAAVGLVLSAGLGWGTEQLVDVPSTLVISVYLLTAIAGVRLLRGAARAAALVSLVLAVVVLPSAWTHLYVPVVVAALALIGRRWVHHRPATSDDRSGRARSR